MENNEKIKLHRKNWIAAGSQYPDWEPEKPHSIGLFWVVQQLNQWVLL